MTEDLIEREKAYRIQERLGILCGPNAPTSEQRQIAEREAYDWELEYRKQWVAELKPKPPIT